MRRLRLLFGLLLLMGSLLPSGAAAQLSKDDAKTLFRGWTADDAMAAGYMASAQCVDGRLAGDVLQGTMGFHYVKPSAVDTTVNETEPELVLIHPQTDRVIAVEYIVPTRQVARPSLFGQDFEDAEPNPGTLQPHYSLHLWLADNSAGEFAEFNPSLPLCPIETLPPPFQQRTGNGTVTFSNASATNDRLALSMELVSSPGLGKNYQAWLLGSDGSSVDAGPFVPGALGAVSLTYTSPTGADLSTAYSGLRITLEEGVVDSPSTNLAFMASFPEGVVTAVEGAPGGGDETVPLAAGLLALFGVALLGAGAFLSRRLRWSRS